MKKTIGLTVLLSMAFLIQDLTADDYLLTANPDYYNPFALSFNYRLNPATTLKNSQFLRLRYSIENLRTSKTVISNDIIKDELMKEMQEIEQRYLAGKASFAELSQARERLNEYLPKKLLTSLGVPNYLEQTKCNSDALAYQAELWNMKKKKFESGVIPLTDVLFEELRFINILRKSQNLSESVKTQLIKEYSKRLDKIYSLKKAEFEAGILSSEEWTKWQKTVSVLKKPTI